MKKICELAFKDMKSHKAIKIIEFIGEMDTSNSAELQEILEPLVEDGHIYLLGDLQKLRFIDSTGNLVLISLLAKTRRKGGAFKLFGLNENLQQFFKEAGLVKIIPVYKNCADALMDMLQEMKAVGL